MSSSKDSYDLLLANGRVMCPAGGVDAVMDVAVKDGEIAAVAPGLDAGAAVRVDCSGKIVTPGLIDSHVHVYTSAHGAMATDDAGIFSGVTTVVDGGSAGYMTFDDLRIRDIENKHTDVYVYMNHNPLGQAIMPEIWAPSRFRMSYERLVESIEANRRYVIGLKDRAVGTFVGCQGIKGVERAKEICAKFNIPYIIHLGVDAVDEMPDYELEVFTRELLGLMGKGDILAHVFTQKRGGIFRSDGKFDREIRAAYERGVYFDGCVGATNFSSETFAIARERGFLPHTISTDITTMSAKGPAKNFGVVMSKFLALGMELKTVIEWVTSSAASIIGMADRKGSLAVGRQADITVSEVQTGDFQFLDRFGGKLFAGNQLFVPKLAFIKGKQFEVTHGGGPTLPE